MLRRAEGLGRKKGDRYLVERMAVLTEMDLVMAQIAAAAVERNPQLLPALPDNGGTRSNVLAHELGEEAGGFPSTGE